MMTNNQNQPLVIIKSQQYSQYCRTAYCEKCAAMNRPVTSNRFLVYRKSTSSFSLLTCKSYTPKINLGFTPHLFKVMGRDIDSGKIVLLKLCLMEHCGIFIKASPKKGVWSLDECAGATQKVSLPCNDYIALVKDFKNSGYEMPDEKFIKDHRFDVEQRLALNAEYIHLCRSMACKS